MYPRLEVSKQLFHHFRRNICRIHQIRKKVRHFRDKRGLPDKCVTLYKAKKELWPHMEEMLFLLQIDKISAIKQKMLFVLKPAYI